MTPTALEVTRLKPCPWCGGETQWGYSSGAKTYFYCIKCRANVHFHNGDSFAEEAQLAALWNTRTSLNRQELREAVAEGVRAAYFDYQGECRMLTRDITYLITDAAIKAYEKFTADQGKDI